MDVKLIVVAALFAGCGGVVAEPEDDGDVVSNEEVVEAESAARNNHPLVRTWTMDGFDPPKAFSGLEAPHVRPCLRFGGLQRPGPHGQGTTQLHLPVGVLLLIIHRRPFDAFRTVGRTLAIPASRPRTSSPFREGQWYAPSRSFSSV